jgi:hypothetical protein
MAGPTHPAQLMAEGGTDAAMGSPDTYSDDAKNAGEALGLKLLASSGCCQCLSAALPLQRPFA